ncbi:hypothetical protein [Sporomusa acidovorans]|uniref:Uncharacterized protein n=1 Tax=Sporomusa acidovorans (strain ATCC 49682 / DSM 3132 / Mol) TaxID=1123286 RepID=A0ABZ3J6Z2_SPOA4|nr:hypothetical protein [Sporomusa acidovorans]OZC18496.1 hypothetical protein SPACI_33620 [Sporomusa acidovorans DSM 3132]SDE36645.1 hypothetical protein SAMN04488499_101232 [Sporomusa acidovorans]
MNGMYALSNIGSSWLSRENLMGSVFAGSAFLYGYLWWKKELFIMGQSTGDQFIDAQLHHVSQTVTSEYMLCIFIHVMFACLLPMGLAFTYWHSENATTGKFSFRAVIFALVLVGAFAGRSLLYVAGSAFLPF